MRRPKSLFSWQFSDPGGEFTNCSRGMSGSSADVGDPFLFARVRPCSPLFATPCAPGLAGKHRHYHHQIRVRWVFVGLR
jgi:hypothetical protein